MQSCSSAIRMQARIKELKKCAAELRQTSLSMVHRARLGHPGGDLSCADILTVLYFDVLRVDPCNPFKEDRDRFILSKGHCSGIFYSTLAKAGFFPQSELETYMQPLSRLNGHPCRYRLPGVEASTGPLGHGLPISAGTALAAKLDDASWRTFVLTGDGELQEGSNWEALMTAAHYKLDNLTLIVDRNGLQQGDATEKTNQLEPLDKKIAAFGWAVREVDGHDIEALSDTLHTVPFQAGHPSCVIAYTHKGMGVSFMQDKVGWHHRVPTDEELQIAFEELEGAIA